MSMTDPEHITHGDFPVDFGRYVLTSLLGEGGMGRVFGATLQGGEGFEKAVAIKVIRRSALGENPGLSAGLRNEARIGALLTHPNIVATNDFAIVEGHPMIAMELLRGLSLDAFLRVSGSLEAGHILDIGRQVADGLSAAHEFEDGAEGVSLVHRDLKPSNIFVTRDGMAKILDLGIAKASEGFSNHTQTGLAKGSFGYMSPEQSAGKVIDGRSDIFSLGVVLYEMVMGQRLFPGTDQREILTALWGVESRLADPEFTGGIDARVPGLGEVLKQTLRDRPEDRYPHALALADALRILSRTTVSEVRLSTVVRTAMETAGAPTTKGPAPGHYPDSQSESTRAVEVGATPHDSTRAVDITEAASGETSHDPLEPGAQNVDEPPQESKGSKTEAHGEINREDEASAQEASRQASILEKVDAIDKATERKARESRILEKVHAIDQEVVRQASAESGEGETADMEPTPIKGSAKEAKSKEPNSQEVKAEGLKGIFDEFAITAILIVIALIVVVSTVSVVRQHFKEGEEAALESQRRLATQVTLEKREADQREAEKRAANKREAEQRAAEQRAAEQRAAEKRAAEKRAAEKNAWLKTRLKGNSEFSEKYKRARITGREGAYKLRLSTGPVCNLAFGSQGHPTRLWGCRGGFTTRNENIPLQCGTRTELRASIKHQTSQWRIKDDHVVCAGWYSLCLGKDCGSEAIVFYRKKI